MNETLDPDKAKMSLSLAVTETFEVMAFFDAAETDPQEQSYENIIQIDISHPFYGSLLFFLKDSLKNRIIDNIYGEESVNLSEASADDCLLEILNIVAGNFMSFYFGNNADYKIELPVKILKYKEHPAACLVNSTFNAEGLKFRVCLCNK